MPGLAGGADGDGFVAEVVLVALMILLNGFFAGAEIAVVSARTGRLKPLAEAGSAAARAALRLKADPDRFLATVQIGVTLVGTLASAVGGVAAVERLEPFLAGLPPPFPQRVAEPLAVGLVVFAIAYLSLVVGELVPKSLAVRHAEGIALVIARPIEVLSRVVGPVVAVLTASSGVFLRLLGQRPSPESPFHTLDDLRAIVGEAAQQGVTGSAVLQGALDLHDREVREVMTPRHEVVAVRRGQSRKEALALARVSRHTRLPVLGDSADDVVGIVHALDLVEDPAPGRPDDWSRHVRPPRFVSWGQRISLLLPELQRQHAQMALALDEHGAFRGLVTLEDLLEVIVGDIQDEHERAAPPLRRLPEGGCDVDASVPVKELNADYGLDLPESSNYVTLGGLILDRLGTVAKAGHELVVPPYRIRVLATDGPRVERAHVEALGEELP